MTESAEITAVGKHVQSLTNDGLLRRNVILNLLGWALPALAALVSIPLLTRHLDATRFGFVALAWAAVGMFSVFDFGLGRVLTRLVAERLALGRNEGIANLIWTASWLLLVLTSVLAAIGIAAATFIVETLLHVPIEFRTEAIGVVQLLALSIPLLTHGVALRGVLEAGQRFGRINQLRIPLGVLSYAGPLIAIPAGGDARIAVVVIVVARAIYWLAHIPFLEDIAPGASRPRRPTRRETRQIAQVGGWITVSSIISPIIVNGDRMVVALAFPIAVTGWYGAASELAIKQWLFPAALGPVLFSALAAAVGTAPHRAIELAERGARITLLGLLPVVTLLAAFAEPGLQLWLGPGYTAEAGSVLRWLALAVYVNSFGHAPYFLLQSGVDARAVGLVHVIELPFYFAALWWAAATFGAAGVAVVWLGRMAIDSVVMWSIVHSRMPTARPSVARVTRLAAVCFVAAVAAAVWGASRS